MRVITVSGKAQAGKDCLGAALVEEFKNRGVKACVFHYADILKLIASTCYGWKWGDKSENGRQLLQRLGTEVFRAVDQDIWVEIMIPILRGLSQDFDVVVLCDCRFVNEITKLRDSMYLDEVFSIRVERDGFDNGLTEEQKRHSSETALDNFKFDLVVKNDRDLKSYLAKATRVIDFYDFHQKKEVPVI